MTPDQARALLDGAAPGGWQWDETGNVAADLRDAGMLAADADLPDKWDTWRDRYTAQRKRAADLEHLVRVKKAENDALKKAMHELIAALDSDDPPTINDESLMEEA